jgi:hypothetical protein
MVPKWSQVTLEAAQDYIDKHKGHSLKCNLKELYSEELCLFSLTQNLPCVIIISVEIETTYPLVKTGQHHKGSG